MARRNKRLDKKLKARESAWVARAEELFLKGDDEAFLASVRRRDGALPSALESAYGEARERVLSRALAAADLPQIEEELSHGEVAGAVGSMARALVCFVDGDDAATRQAWQRAVEAGATDHPLSSGLAALLGEAGSTGLSAKVKTLVRSSRRVDSLVEAVAAGRGVAAKSFEHPVLEAVRQMLAGLVAVTRRGHAAGPSSVAQLLAGCAQLAQQAPKSAALAAVEPRARLLEHALAAEKQVRKRRGTLAWLAIDELEIADGNLGLLEARTPAVAAGIHFALRRRLRLLLTAVLERDGSEGLAHLLAEYPALTCEVQAGGRGVSAEDPSFEAQRLCVERQHLGPATFAEGVAQLAKAEEDPLRWSQLALVELEARHGTVQRIAFEPEETLHQATEVLQRVRQIALATKRLPAALAKEMARLLRWDVAELSGVVNCGEGWLHAGQALLVFLPNDAFLLTVAIAGAKAAGDPRAVQQLESKIEKAPEQNIEEELLRPLLDGLAGEHIPVIKAALGALQRLLSAPTWKGARSSFAVEFAVPLLDELENVEQMFEAMGPMGAMAGSSPVDQMAADVRTLADLLGGLPDYDALEIALGYRGRGVVEHQRKVEEYLAHHTGVPEALILYRSMCDVRREEEGASWTALAEVVMARIEPGRPLEWIRALPMLATDLGMAGLRQLRKLLKREKQLCEDPELLDLLDEYGEVYLGQRRSRSKRRQPPRPTREPRGKGRRQERRKSTQRKDDQLDLF